MIKTKHIIPGILLTLAATTASAKVINDNYVGGANGNDVIGDPGHYGISSMNVEMLAGSKLSVTINTAFAGNSGAFLQGSTTGNTGVSYGDLFLSSAWTPFGAAPYADDVASNGTVWTYGISLDNRLSNAGGAATIYSLGSGDNDADALLSDDFITSGSYRSGQEIAVDTSSANVAAVAGVSSWSVGATSISFLIDLSNTSLAASETIALHWGMSCANDVIEGEFRVPEPAILSLLAFGLLSIGIIKRRKA